MIGWPSIAAALSISDWIGISGSVIGLGGTAVTLLATAPAFNKKMQELRKGREMSFLLGSRDVEIFIPSRNVKRVAGVIAGEDLEAANSLARMLSSLQYQCEVKYIAPSGEFKLSPDKSHIVICGPKNSPTIRRFFDAMPFIDLKRAGRNWVFFDRATHNVHVSPMDREPSEKGDIAFFEKVTIDNSEKPVLLICGIHAIGSLGAVAFMKDKANMTALCRRVGKGRFFCLIRSKYNEDASIKEAEVYYPPRTI